MKNNIWKRGLMVSAAAALTLTVAACGSSTASDTASSAKSAAGSATDAAKDTTAAPTTESSTAAAAGENFGAGCAAVPTDATDPGSFASMAQVPVATAASGNPLLSTLVSTVGTAGLVDTLNDTSAEYTVFAPTNDAFAALGTDTLNTVTADVPLLTSILTYHVLPMRLAPEELAGTFTTVNGADLTIEGSGEDFTVGDAGASVICGNVQTSNATVYIIDSVLMPPA